MKGPKPSISRHFNGAIVTFEIAVMQLVEKITRFGPNPVIWRHKFETGMAKHGMCRLHITVKENMDRVTWQNQVDREVSVEQKVFDWVHGNSGPRSDVHVPMM